MNKESGDVDVGLTLTAYVEVSLKAQDGGSNRDAGRSPWGRLRSSCVALGLCGENMAPTGGMRGYLVCDVSCSEMNL